MVSTRNHSKYEKHIEKYLHPQGIHVDIGSDFPVKPESYDLIVPLNFPKILNQVVNHKNVIVFHTSDLPLGRGWSPIANIFLKEEKFYCLTCFVANSSIDAGDILMKMRFKIRANDTATSIRKIDDNLMILGILLILSHFKGKEYCGISQDNQMGTYFPKRNKEENEIFLDQSIDEILPMLRSVESEHNCFVTKDGYTFELVLNPTIEPKFPSDITVEFLYKNEKWDLSTYLHANNINVLPPEQL